MYLNHNLFFTFIFSFITYNFIIPLLTVNSFNDITFISTNKLYLSTIFGLIITLSQVWSYDNFNKTFSKSSYFIYFILLILYLYAYKTQLYVDDIDYLKDVKENLSKNIFISSKRKKITKSKNIKLFVNLITKTHEKNITIINKFL